MRIDFAMPLLALAVVACTHTMGHDFMTPSSSQLNPGTTTKNNVIAMFGAPDTESAFVSSGGDVAQQPKSEFDTAPVPGSFSNVRYRFIKTTAPIAGGEISVKQAGFTFQNNVLVAYNFVSNFPDHPTNFDESRISLLKKGQTTRSEVEAILGSPTGEAIYPMTLKPGETKLFYTYSAADLHTHKIAQKELVALFNLDSRLIDFRFGSNTKNITVVASPVPAPVPVFIPIHK